MNKKRYRRNKGNYRKKDRNWKTDRKMKKAKNNIQEKKCVSQFGHTPLFERKERNCSETTEKAPDSYDGKN